MHFFVFVFLFGDMMFSLQYLVSSVSFQIFLEGRGEGTEGIIQTGGCYQSQVRRQEEGNVFT